MRFTEFAPVINQQIKVVQENPERFQMELPKNDLWNLYLASFPEGSNDIFKVRAEHDCNCCKNFIRDVGAMVSFKDGKMVTIWDVEVPEPYNTVVKQMAEYLRHCEIRNIYTCLTQKIGAETSHSHLEDGSIYKWNHFYGEVTEGEVGISPSHLSVASATVKVFKRGLEEISPFAIKTVMDLIDEGNLYRGEEHKGDIKGFVPLQIVYSVLRVEHRNNFLWTHYQQRGTRIRNTVIGTLLSDLSKGEGIEAAVKAFESKVAPENYKRPKPLITKSMVERAMKAIDDAGIRESLPRRFAKISDIAITDVLFADRSVKPHMKDDLLASLMDEVKAPIPYTGMTDSISIDDFIEKVLPNIESLEVYFEHKHTPNLVSLIGPQNVEAPKLFKWANPFSWSYAGNVADSSIKQRVKAAGGAVDGYMRVSLSWTNYDDLDIHVIEPGGNEIYFANSHSRVTLGNLDVDMNANRGLTREAVENITWPEMKMMRPGIYQVRVQNFKKRESIDIGFEVEVECQGVVYNLTHDKPIPNNYYVPVAKIHFDGKDIIKMERSGVVEAGVSSRDAWGLKTNQFHKVSLMTLSPNHWHGSAIGNKHYMFMLDGCKNDEQPRGFYNEYLPSRYNEFRKTFEVLADKTKCEITDEQLSGLGFSSRKTDLLCRVNGSRLWKISF